MRRLDQISDKRVEELEREGMSHSDAISVALAEPLTEETTEASADALAFVAEVFPADARYTLDGETIDLARFLDENEELTWGEVMQIKRLMPGEFTNFGGGAQPIFQIKRIA